MEKTEFLPNVQTEEKKENAESVQSNAVNADMNAAAQDLTKKVHKMNHKPAIDKAGKNGNNRNKRNHPSDGG